MIARRKEKLHRIATVRGETGQNARVVARKMGMTLAELRETENETTDVWLSDLHRMAAALGVPVRKLLLDTEVLEGLSKEDLLHLEEFSKQVDEMATLVDVHESNEEPKVLITVLANQLAELLGQPAPHRT